MPPPPSDFDTLLNGPVATEKEIDSVFGSALTLASLANAGTVRQHVRQWAESLAPRIVERWRAFLSELVPREDNVRAALAGAPALYESELRSLRERGEELRGWAEEVEIEAERGLVEASGAASVLLRDRTTPPEETAKGNVFSRAYGSLLAFVGEAETPAAPDLASLPEDLRRSVRALAERFLRVEVQLAVAGRIDTLASEVTRRFEENQRGIDALVRVRERIAGEAEDRSRAFAARDNVLPGDLVADDEESVACLLRGLRPVRTDALIEARTRLDEGAAERTFRMAIADEQKRLAQRPAQELLPILLGARSLREPLDAFVRNSAPLAPLDRDELADRRRFDGVTVAVVEARDPALRRQLREALERSGDVTVLEAGQERLPEGVLARIVRYLGHLPAETAAGLCFELMRMAGTPLTGKGPERDWIEDDLPPIVSPDRLAEEIRRRDRRGENTDELTGWLSAMTPATMAAK